MATKKKTDTEKYEEELAKAETTEEVEKAQAKKPPAEVEQPPVTDPNAFVFDDVHTQAEDMASPHGWVTVVKGEHEGRVGHIDGVGDVDKDGVPKTVILRTRDEDDARLIVKYEDLRDLPAGTSPR